jgi:hypothetical protein
MSQAERGHSRSITGLLRFRRAKGDYLERVKALVDFDMLRSALEAAVPRVIRVIGFPNQIFDDSYASVYGPPSIAIGRTDQDHRSRLLTYIHPASSFGRKP